MKSLLLVVLAGCSVTDDAALTPAEPRSWTSRIDAEVGGTPESITVGPDGDAIVAESVWSCVDGASAGVLRIDQATGASRRVDWVRGYATSAVAGPSGFSALLATSSPSDPWSFGLSFRDYTDDGSSFRTYEERSAVPVEMDGDPEGYAVLRGTHADTGVGFIRALNGSATRWQVDDAVPATRYVAHVATAGEDVVTTLFGDAGTWGLVRYDDRGRPSDEQPFCGGLVAGDESGDAFGAAITTDGTASLTLCRADRDGKGAWTVVEDLGSASYADVAGIAVGANQIVVTGGQDVQGPNGVQYVVWTRAYDRDGGLLWHEVYAAADNTASWSVGAAIGQAGEVYVLGGENTANGAAPVVLRYR